MGKLKILYYSNAFIANHGGRLHSEAFYRETSKSREVHSVEAFPAPIRNQSKKSSNDRFRGFLKKNPLLQILFFYRRNKRSYKEIIKKIRNSKGGFNVLHIRLDSNFLIISKLKKEFPKLLITTEVNASPFDENFSNIAFIDHFRRLERKMLEKADANFFVSGYLKNMLMEQPNETRDFVVHNGVDLNIFQPKQENENRGTIIFGYVGTIDYHKNLKTLIDAFSAVVTKFNKAVKLLVVGDGPMMEDIKNYIKLKDLEEHIELAGWVPHNEIVKYLHRMDVAIHHSANPYMSPLKIFEYMAVGLPVIGPDIPGVKEIFENNKEIILVKNDKKDLIAKMEFLLTNQFEIDTIAARGKNKVRNYFGWEHNAERILSVLSKKIK